MEFSLLHADLKENSLIYIVRNYNKNKIEPLMFVTVRFLRLQ
jgi:hypothetical protein